jgi:hypothetical protein
MYNVHLMKRYTVAQARERLSDLLNQAEAGDSVVIERRGVRYQLRAEGAVRPGRSRRSMIETIDADVASGQWSWVWGPKGVRFSRRSRRS